MTDVTLIDSERCDEHTCLSGWKSDETENIVNLQYLSRSPWCSLLPRGSPTLEYQETSSMVITEMEDTAKTYFDMKDRDEVATVPAHLKDPYCKLTMDTVSISGLSVL